MKIAAENYACIPGLAACLLFACAEGATISDNDVADTGARDDATRDTGATPDEDAGDDESGGEKDGGGEGKGRGEQKGKGKRASGELSEDPELEATAGTEEPKYYCGMCQDELDPDDAALAGCKHVFHRECIAQYAACAPARGEKTSEVHSPVTRGSDGS